MDAGREILEKFEQERSAQMQAQQSQPMQNNGQAGKS
jgi:hypothetical protein